MLKCPFCQFDNEEGALFCEQCKSDLSGVESSVPVAAVLEESVPVAEAYSDPIPLADVEPSVPVADVFEAAPVAEAVPADAEPVAEAVPLAEEPLPAPLPAMAPPPVEEPPPAAPVAEAAPVKAAAAPPPPATLAAPPVAAAAVAAAAAPAGEGSAFPAGATPKLVVIRGQKVNFEFPIYPDLNFIGRSDEKPVDIDLEDQEPPDRVWTSRQHALITFEEGRLTIEDLNSANGTYVNRTRVYPGQKRALSVNDVVQIGTVHMKVKV